MVPRGRKSREEDYAPSTARIEAFSDGVIAIIVTLLILEIRIPQLPNLSNRAVLDALVALGPKFVGFAVSFVTVAIFWVNHHLRLGPCTFPWRSSS